VRATGARGLGRRIDFTQQLHASTPRDYVARVVEHDKAESATVALRFDRDYWDGDRRFGYGGYRYDGRWLPIARDMAAHYGIAAGDRILDVGCGKGFLLHEFTRAVPGVAIAGIDISAYALEHALPAVKPFLVGGPAHVLPFADAAFDLVVSLGTLHNLGVGELFAALAEIERVGRRAYVMVESYRDEREKANLLYWQLTCRSFYSVSDWEWVFERAGYHGDYGFIFFT
jgi:SAM-dependent methyltransferase